MSNIFDGESDSDVEIKTNNAYAKNYNNWRKKEELNKRKINTFLSIFINNRSFQ